MPLVWGGASRSSLRPSSRPSARLCLLASYVPRTSSSYPFIISPALPLPVSSAPHGFRCLPHPFASLIVSSVRPLPRIAWLPVLSTSGAGRKCDPHRREDIGGGWRTVGGVVAACLPRMASGGHRRWMAAGGLLACLGAFCPWMCGGVVGGGRCGRGRGCLLVLGGGDGWDGSVISSSHLIGSSNRLRFSPGSSHRLGSWIIPSTGSWLLFHFSLTPSRLLFSACLPWLVPPSPAGGCAGCGMACGGGRAGCLHAFSSPVPLSRCRSFAHCYTPRVARAVVPARGVVGHFMGYFCRLLVGVGVFKYMPLNRILWLLTGIFGDSVRCHFSALPVASSSLICSVSCHLSAAASWRWCGCFPAVSW